MVIVHSEGYSLPAKELDLANRIFDRWRDEGKHPSLLCDTGSLVVKYVQVINTKKWGVSGDGNEEDAAGSVRE